MQTKKGQKLDEPRFRVEITIDSCSPFYDLLLEAIDETFSSLGEAAKNSIYFHLENSMGIKKQEIPFRINDFENALEKIFGIGAIQLEILLIKHLHEKAKITCKWTIPKFVASELTFLEYIRLAKKEFEKRTQESTSKNGERTN